MDDDGGMAETETWRPRHTVTVGACVVLGVLVVGWFAPYQSPLQGTAAWAQTMFGYGVESDLGQDLVGARALLDGGDAYPSIGPAMMGHFGVDWDVAASSTHPPTAFLFALPLAGLSWTAAAAVWSIVTATMYAAAIRLLELPPLAATGVAVGVVLWPPTAWSYGQFVALWLLCGVLTWRWRDRPGLAGFVIAVVAMTKLFPALLLLMFIKRRQWQAVWSFLATGAVALGIVAVLNTSAVSAYVSGIFGEANGQMERMDNGALLAVAPRLGAVAIIGAIGLVVAICRVALLSKSRTVEWMALMWLGVAALPVLWSYSVVPLLPVLLGGAVTRRPVPVTAVALAVFAPFLAPLSDAWSAGVSTFVLVAAAVPILHFWRSCGEEVVPDLRAGEHLVVHGRLVDLPVEVAAGAGSAGDVEGGRRRERRGRSRRRVNQGAVHVELGGP